jgi:nucleoside-diphosphate kinase
MSNDKSEETLVLIKPDALKNSLTGYVLSQLAEFHTGLRFAATKIVQVDRRLAGEHYAEHQGKVFFPSLLEYITGRLHYPGEPWKQRVIAIVYQGKNAIKLIREIAGPTNPHIARDEKPGCIRALGTVVPLKDNDGNVVGERMDNLIHASADASDAEREIKLWFAPNDVPPSMRTFKTEVNEAFYYLKDNKLQTEHESGSKCFLAPGSIAWKSDLEALSLIAQGKEAQCSLDAVVSKYLINEKQEI